MQNAISFLTTAHNAGRFGQVILEALGARSRAFLPVMHSLPPSGCKVQKRVGEREEARKQASSASPFPSSGFQEWCKKVEGRYFQHCCGNSAPITTCCLFSPQVRMAQKRTGAQREECLLRDDDSAIRWMKEVSSPALPICQKAFRRLVQHRRGL